MLISNGGRRMRGVRGVLLKFVYVLLTNFFAASLLSAARFLGERGGEYLELGNVHYDLVNVNIFFAHLLILTLR